MGAGPEVRVLDPSVWVLDPRCELWTRGEGSGPEVWVLDPRCGFWTRGVGSGPKCVGSGLEVWVLDPSVCVNSMGVHKQFI